MLSLHVIGLAMVAGIAFVLGLRLLGLFPGIPAQSLLGLIWLAWAGFAVNALSGSALFSSQATIFVESAPFLIKAACKVIQASAKMRITILDHDASPLPKGRQTGMPIGHPYSTVLMSAPIRNRSPFVIDFSQSRTGPVPPLVR